MTAVCGPVTLVLNLTDGSSAEIVSVDNDNKITTTALSGGDDDTWADGRFQYRIVVPGDGADRIFGQGEPDKIYGGGEFDYLDGGAGSDRVKGGDGSDTLVFNKGSDRLDGQDGGDGYFAILQGGNNESLVIAQDTGNEWLGPVWRSTAPFTTTSSCCVPIRRERTRSSR